MVGKDRTQLDSIKRTLLSLTSLPIESFHFHSDQDLQDGALAVSKVCIIQNLYASKVCMLSRCVCFRGLSAPKVYFQDFFTYEIEETLYLRRLLIVAFEPESYKATVLLGTSILSRYFLSKKYISIYSFPSSF